MSDRWWTAVLVYPALTYSSLIVLSHFGSSDLAFPLGFLATFGFGTATGLGILRRPTWVWVGRLLFVLATLVPFSNGIPTSGAPLDFACGITLGAPFLWLEYAWHDTATPGTRVVALQSALLVGVLELATLGVTPNSPGGSAGGQFLQALGQVIAGQLEGVASVLVGTNPSSMPLESTLDVVYVALGALALAGVLLSWLSPRTALDEPLPWSWVRYRASPLPTLPPSEETMLRPGQRDALATRTLAHPPDAMLAPGFGPLIVAALIVVGFVVLAVTEPGIALLVLVLGTLGAGVAVARVLSRRLTPLGGLST